MARGTPYFAGLSKTDLKKAIQRELAQYSHWQEFRSPLISDLISTKHYYCAPAGVRIEHFRKVPNSRTKKADRYDFQGCFPGRGWHSVSWTQCIDPKDDRDLLKDALRDAIRPLASTYRATHPQCERCNAAASQEVDHVEPEFDVIARIAIESLTQEEKRQALAGFEFWLKEPFTLPPDHKAVRMVVDAHKTAKLQAVCRACHVASAASRRV